MSDSSSDPKKYTIEEMMDRLNGRDSSESPAKLVTRSDGSQAMKVRRRKRRTTQAFKEETKRNHRIQVMQIAGFVSLVVLLGLAAGIGILYANSSAFRESLLVKLEDSSGAKVSLIQFRINPAAANANKVLLEWPGGNALSTLELVPITAKIAPQSFLGKVFGGEEIVADKGKLLLSAPAKLLPARYKPAPDGNLPVKFQRYSVPSLDIRFGETAGHRRTITGTEASFYTGIVADHSEIRLRGGLLEFDEWPPLSLDRSYMKRSDGRFQIQSMRFMAPKGANKNKAATGFIDFSGTVRPLEAAATHTLEANVQGMQLPYLVGADFGRIFMGGVDNSEIPDSNFLTFSPDSPESSVLELTLTNSLDSRIELGGLMFLSQLSAVLNERWYESPIFVDDVAFVVKRRGSEVEIKEINLVSRGRMAIRGSLSNGKGGAISGILRIGLPETTVSAAENKRLNRLFGPTHEGYRWLDVKVGGTSAMPKDNFKELYTKAAEAPAEESKDPDDNPDNFEYLIEGGE
jgi:hypothetical protein